MTTYYDRTSRISAVKLGTLFYCFRTLVEGTTATALGHLSGVTAGGNLISGGIIGCNSPKPGRAKKFVGATKGYESSWYDLSKKATLIADGWDLTKPRFFPKSLTSQYSKCVQVKMSAGELVVPYGWVMPLWQYSAISADLGGLGITLVEAEDFKSVPFGVNKPRPKRASKKLSSGKATTFVSQEKESNLPTGWILSGSGSSAGVEFE